SVLDRKAGIALKNLCGELGRFAFAPAGSCVADAVADWAAVGSGAPFDGARDTDEFGFECFGGGADYRVAVAAHVDESEMRGEMGIGSGAGLGDVAGFSVFEAGCDAVPEQEIDRGLRPGVRGRLAEEERTKRMILRKFVFEGFDQAGCGN